MNLRQQIVERRHAPPAGVFADRNQRLRRQGFIGHVRHQPRALRLRQTFDAPEIIIVINHDRAVAGQADVGFDAVRADPESALKSGNRIFG